MITNLNLEGLRNGSVTQLGGGSLFTTGKVFYVSSTTGSNGNLGTDPAFPKATIAGAQSAATASKGDVVVILPAHAETVTSPVTLSKAGLTYIGIGSGSLRPTITVNAAVDGISITAANVSISNIGFAAPETDDATAMINVAAANARISNIYGIGSQTAKNFVDGITVASGGDDVIIENFRLYNTVVDMTSAISFEAAVARPVVRHCTIQGQFATAAIMDEATATLALIENNLFKNTKAATAVMSFSNNSTGVCRFNHVSGRHTTLASNVATGTGMDFFENRVVEEAALNGAIIPAADAD